jgi:hypothetical protein
VDFEVDEERLVLLAHGPIALDVAYRPRTAVFRIAREAEDLAVAAAA